MKVFLPLVALFVVTSAGESDPFRWDVEVRLGKNFEEQHGSISSMKFNHWGWKDSQIVDDKESLPHNVALIPGEDIKGNVRLDKVRIQSTKSIEFQWESDRENAGPIRIYDIRFPRPYPKKEGFRIRGATFCHEGLIQPGQTVKFYNCN